ncbi:MAG: Holliday junction branch migration protein RuvA [Cryobacterium sp.]|nr:Holliday junction branch migration protein RuvA [Cryobacterium sp.]MBX3104397.1 Holliday junction branch migration protein RuvA [Cryobacterium sp.]
MIASLRGRVLSVSGGVVIIEVGGVGLQVAVTSSFALTLSPDLEVSVFTSLVVREDELSLYGFDSIESKEVFDLLRSVSGVGPKSALAVLGVLGAEGVALAVASDDDAAFRKVSGIGPKTAKLITVSLAGKIQTGVASLSSSKPAKTTVSADVIRALVGLGWNERVSESAVSEVLSDASESAGLTTDSLLRSALARLASSSARSR